MRIWGYTVAALLFCAQAFAQGGTVERPPQFVLISFDGSYSHNFWEESLAIADKTDARFSYFISGVYFLPKNLRSLYKPPRHSAGSSDIGFGEIDPSGIEKRVNYVWKAILKGFDVGSHVNGHFDGGRWSRNDWSSEFSQFHRFVGNVFSINKKIEAPFKSEWTGTLQSSLKGFRAPLLAYNSSSDQVLKDFKYLYDASGQSEGQWPTRKNNGVWNMSLSRIKLAGTRTSTVAMDYNIFYGHCNGRFRAGNPAQECSRLTPERLKAFEDQVYQSYIARFQSSYYGNRAPLSIGHHFSLWNRGVYWKALQRAIYNICKQPETRCITHKDMVKWMESTVKERGVDYVAKLNKGEFKKSDIPSDVKNDLSNLNLAFMRRMSKSSEYSFAIEPDAQKVMLQGDLAGAHTDETNEVDMAPYRINPDSL